MIDERAVQVAKFWAALGSLRAGSGLRESEFEQFALMMLSLSIVAHAHVDLRDNATYGVKIAFDVVMDAIEDGDKNRLRDAWNKACNQLAEFVRTSDTVDVPREVASPRTFHDIVRLFQSFEEAWGSRQEFLLNCFDEVFHRAASRLAGVGYRNGDTAAALAAYLSADIEHISEYFATTGEFAVLRHTLLNVKTNSRLAVMDRLNFFIGLRLEFHGIEAQDQQPRENNLASFVNQRFLLLDHPHRKSGAQIQRSPSWFDHNTSLGALEHLLQNQNEPQLGLIVVPGLDRSANGWRADLRRHLVRSGLLHAVVDLPNDRSDKSKKRISAWFLKKKQSHRNHVLMVNVKGFSDMRALRETNTFIELAAAIVTLDLADDENFRGSSGRRQFKNDEVETLMQAYFKDGYQDMDGICRRVNTGELAENDYTLAASVYLNSVHMDKKRKTFMPLLNSTPVLEELRQGHGHGKRIYVIGNNGEGKSVLLNDLALRLVDEGRRVIGVSFGLTDRFPFKQPKSEDQPFIYVGARTSERGITLSRTSADLNRLVREIHMSSEKLDVFSAVVKYLGFGERRYLVPIELSTSFNDHSELYAQLQQLTENAKDNARLLQQASANRYELGLMRQESQRPNSITTFQELSSGEQQLLTLALKITAYAGSNTVILIDEPELSLHVSWQRSIPGMLEIVGSRMDCSMVVATHSPVVIASATHHDDKCFVARQHALTELGLRQRQSVETALFDGFRTYTANNRQVHERCAAMVSQTIQRLNSTSPMQDGAILSEESLYEELKLMDQIIRLADSAQLSHARHDLELIAHTRAALNELGSINRIDAV